MKVQRLALALALPAALGACATISGGDTLANLRGVHFEIKEERIDGGIEKAIAGYRRFLEETPESRMTPEAIRRLADLKVKKEYGVSEDAARHAAPAARAIGRPAAFDAAGAAKRREERAAPARSESDVAFEKRATASAKLPAAAAATPLTAPDGAAADLENASAREAIELYKKLLARYPHYERNDQALYNMSRAYEELGQVEEAMAVMTRIVRHYPRSKYLDEVQFRRGEYFFTRRKYLDAEEAYKAVIAHGPATPYYEHALYKLGWSLYKQQLYEDALERFVGVLDHRVTTGYDFEKGGSEIERKRVDDTFRVISLSFAYTSGPAGVVEHFDRHGKRPYELSVYANLGEHYLEKRRYADAASAYRAFVKRNPFHKIAPDFDMRVIDIYKKGGFPRLVIDGSKAFATHYGLKSEYWKHFDIKTRPEVVVHLKQNLRELANYYHSLYQNKELARDRDDNFRHAQHWYREFLDSFPRDTESPAINYQLAELLLEQRHYGEAATEFERTAYAYTAHDKAPAAGYAAVYAHREHAKGASGAALDRVRREVIRSSLQFVERFPKHDKAAIVLGAAADDLYDLKDYPQSLTVATRLIKDFPAAETSLQRSAWIVVAHASFELQKYPEAEAGYQNVLKLSARDDKSLAGFSDNLAASIYKQGEQAIQANEPKIAVRHFLRIAEVAPGSKIRPSAEYDAASALLKMRDWDRAVEVLQAFRKDHPAHELQGEVTKKMAFAYREAGKLAVAAAEYERVERESKDGEVRRGALLMAADLYEDAADHDRALEVYRRYISAFPKPLELALESRHKIATLHKNRNHTAPYLAELRLIRDLDANAGRERTARTRYLGANAALGLVEPLYAELTNIKLVKPFQKNLQRKKTAMKAATDAFSKLVSYEVGDVTAAATYYLAEINFHFSRALAESERPDNLNALEREQYELALEEQVFPFEERAIAIHEKNLELLALGVHSPWIEKSLDKLGRLVPARYARPEVRTGYLTASGDTPALFARGPQP
jgi:TolA-binding protein